MHRKEQFVFELLVSSHAYMNVHTNIHPTTTSRDA